MNITTNLDEISPTSKKPESGYEWWYLDAISNDGAFSFVIIMYQNNPFSLNKIRKLNKKGDTGSFYPAISVSVYHKSKPIYYSFLEFKEEHYKWEQDELHLQIEKNWIKWDLVDRVFKVRVNLEQELACGFHLNADIKGEAKKLDKDLLNVRSQAPHSWNLIHPALDIAANLKLNSIRGDEHIHFKGRGYHDHNTGYEPLKDSFQDWYWGRFHLQDMTFIYYLMNINGEEHFKGWLLRNDDNSVVEEFQAANLENFNKNVFGLNSAHRITLKSGQTIINIAVKDKIDSAPFYQRFMSEIKIIYKREALVAQGVTEYLNPKKIYSRLYWPLVKMRLRDAIEKPHWVQKSPFLYPITW